jgi:non-heme chloroperoxidase
MKAFTVTSPDGVSIAAQEWGNPDGPEILLIHGFNQCHLAWTRQVNDPGLAREFRIVTFDLRGHGISGMPLDPDAYAHDQRWADDVKGVITAAGLKRPVLVAWSYGGRVITDYVRAYGTAQVAAINFVAAVTKTDPTLHGTGGRFFVGMASADLAENIAATRGFARACFEIQPTAEEFETILAYNMLMPLSLRPVVRNRVPNPGDMLGRLDVPVLVTQGERDVLVLLAMGQMTAAAVKGATLSVYKGIGHAPFWEDAPRFNRELAAFVRAANG